MMSTKYQTAVHVKFTSGRTKCYPLAISSTSAGALLARVVGETGVLLLVNGDESYSIPIAHVQEYRIVPAYTIVGGG